MSSAKPLEKVLINRDRFWLAVGVKRTTCIALARQLGIQQRTLASWVSPSKQGKAYKACVDAVALALGCDADFLIDGGADD